jgi:hypothetical protein
MLIKIGYDIALKFPFPTTVIHLLYVHPSRPISLHPSITTDPELMTDSAATATASALLQALSAFSARHSSVPSKLFGNELGFAATSRTWRSRSAGA